MEYVNHPGFNDLLSGNIQAAIIGFNSSGRHITEGPYTMFAAWTPTREGTTRPDKLAALADLRDMTN